MTQTIINTLLPIPASQWQDSFPQTFSRPDYQESFGSNLDIFSPDSGPEKTMKRTISAPKNIKVSCIATQQQKEDIERFLIATEGEHFGFPDLFDPRRYIVVRNVSQGESMIEEMTMVGINHWKITLHLMVRKNAYYPKP